MRIKEENNIIYIYLEGRIDSGNASVVDQEIMEVLDANPGREIAFDASGLKYISSAGLRVLLKVRKKLDRPFVVREVSLEVYDIFETTGFTELLEVKKKLKSISVEGCPVVGLGGNGTVYQKDADTIVKVYNPGTSLEKIEFEKKYARAAFQAGLPTAISFNTVKVGDQYGIMFEMLDARTVGRAITEEPDRLEEYGRMMGKLFKKMHATSMEAGRLPRFKDKASSWIDYLEERYVREDLFEAEDIESLRRVLAAIPERDTILHCDFHEGNVMVQDGDLVLIDLDDICTGHPVFDLIFNYMGHVVGAQASPEITERTMGIKAELAPKVRAAAMEIYFGTKDRALLDQYDQILGAFTVFMMLLVPAKSKDSRNVPEETAFQIIKVMLPQFRPLADQLPMMLDGLPV